MPLTSNKVIAISLLLVFSASLVFNSNIVNAANEPYFFSEEKNYSERQINPSAIVSETLGRIQGLHSVLFNSDRTLGLANGLEDDPGSNFEFFNREDLTPEIIWGFLRAALVLAINLFIIVIKVTGQVLGVVLGLLTS